MRKQVLAAAVGIGAVMSLVGCAQQVGDIDRTQPNKLRKSIFNSEDEWYVRSTVVEANSTSRTSFAGLQGEMQRVRWEITEDSLVAYRAHEDVIGLDTNQFNPETDGPFYGRPAAAFSIQGHFDVQRQYNASTGEQSNVITENSSDRPWYERDWFRVDWSRNMAPADESLDPAVEIQSIAGLQIAPQDSGLKADDITWYIDTDEKGEVNYLEVVNIYQIYPDWEGCLLSFDLTAVRGGGCGVETVKVRTSFLKVDPDKVAQHEPRVYSDRELDKFGYFRTGRCVYDRNYGCRDTSQIWLANIWRIWDDALDADGNFKPYAERTPHAFAYYTTPGFPEDLVETTQDIINQWNSAYVDVVDFYQPGFRETGGPDGGPGRIFYLCSNPGSADEPGYKAGVCKNPGVMKQLGDLRYSFMSWVDNDQPTGPLGYGPSSADPLTGEIINANANVYGAAIDSFVQYTLDLLMLMNGDLDPEQYGYGRNVEAYLDGLRDEGLYLGYGKYLDQHKESLENVKNRIATKESPIFALRDSVKGRPASERMEPLRMTTDRGAATWNKLRGTELEQMMLTDEIRRGIVDPQVTLFNQELGMDLGDEEVLNMVSPARLGSKRAIMANHDVRLNRFSSRNMMMAEFYDDSYLGLATRIKELMEGEWAGLDEDARMAAARSYLRKEIYSSVMEHEVGHTMGLFHNFEGTFDALNFFPKYWENRFTDYDGDGNIDMIDPSQPLTRAQLATGIREQQYSSIMDYGARFALDISGIGLYDKAAIHYGYGNLVSVFNNTPTKIQVDYSNSDWDSVQPSNTPISTFGDIDTVSGVAGVTDQDPSQDGGALDNGLNFYHYAVLPYLFQGTDGNMANMYDRRLVRLDEKQAGDVEVPFRFCSDFYRGGRPGCDVYDEGASFDEIMDSYIRSYENYYFFNNFRRGRAGWGLFLWPTVQRYLSRYFAPIVNIYQHWVIRLFEYDDQWYTADWGGRLGWAGIERGIGSIMNTMVTPHPGTYGWNPQTETWENIATSEDYRPPVGSEDANLYTDYMNVPLGVGKYDISRYDTDGGHYYFFHYEILTTFFERWMAMAALTDPSTNFIGVDASSDITAFSIPITLLYNQEMYRWFGSLINGDMSEIGHLVDESNGKMEVTRQNPLAGNLLQTSYRSRQKLNPYSSVYGNRSFNLEYFAMLYGLAWFQDRFDRSFNSVANVRVLGRGDNFELPEGWESITWTDLTTGVTYIAGRSDFDIQRGTYPAGWNMLQTAKELEAEWLAASCPNNATSLQDCNQVVNGEYYQMESHREMVDLMALSNAIFYDWNVQYLPWE